MKRALWTSLVCCLAVLLGSCGGSADDTSNTDQQEATEDPVASPSPETPTAGPYCFSFKDETLTLDVELILDEDQSVTGRQVGVVEDEEEGYFTSYESSLTGVLEGHTLTLDIVTEIEEDTQEEQAEWTWDGATLNDGLHELIEGACGLSEDAPGDQPLADEQRVSHCRSEEMAIFSCRLEDSEKVASICASQDFSSDQGYLQYRFGPIGDVELEYPEDQQNTHSNTLNDLYEKIPSGTFFKEGE